jgi:hypothetical protein
MPESPAPPSAPSTPTPKRFRTPFVLAGLAVATIAAAGWFALSTADDSAASDSDSATSGDESTPPTGLDIAPQDVSSPLVVPIDDASEVMAEVNDNSAEAEALDLLGLDETGNQVPDVQPAAGHRFTWTYGSDNAVTITVDTTTGNYQFESSDGIERRRVDGTSYDRRADITWTQTDGVVLESVPRLGFYGPITLEQIIDQVTDEYATSTTSQLADGTTQVTAEVDAFAYSEGHSGERLDWMTVLGHPAATTVQPGEIVVIQAQLDADGSTVNLMTVTTSTFATSYTLDELFASAPVIAAPEL